MGKGWGKGDGVTERPLQGLTSTSEKNPGVTCDLGGSVRVAISNVCHRRRMRAWGHDVTGDVPFILS